MFAPKVNALLHAAWHDNFAQALLALLFSCTCQLQGLGDAGTAKIADVGLARIMQHTMSNTATGDPAGTFAYAAPEMLMGEKWDDKVGCSLPLCLSVCAIETVMSSPVCLFATSCSAIAVFWALVKPTNIFVISLYVDGSQCQRLQQCPLHLLRTAAYLQSASAKKL